MATVRGFWEATFRETWEALLPAMQTSVEEKQRLYEECSFQEFLRHTLLPIELVEKRKVLRALRGGYELPLADIKECIFTPSVFNDIYAMELESTDTNVKDGKTTGALRADPDNELNNQYKSN